MNVVKRLKLLREGFCPTVVKENTRLTGDWLFLQAVHPTDLSDIEVPTSVDYSHCFFHEVVKGGPDTTLQSGVWVVIIRNALDGLTPDRKYVVAQEKDVVMVIDPDDLPEQ
jgi:hypothetical protein